MGHQMSFNVCTGCIHFNSVHDASGSGSMNTGDVKIHVGSTNIITAVPA